MIRLVLLSLLLATPGSVEKGSLRLTSLPGVAVEWEGIALGETGADGVLWVRDIPPGDYTLTLSKPGYRSRSTRLTISSGETAVSLGLERLPAPPPARRQPAAEPPRRPPPPATRTGSADAVETPGEAPGAAAEPEPPRREPASVAPGPQVALPPRTTAAPPVVEPPQVTGPHVTGPEVTAPPPAAASPVPESQTAAAGGASGAQGPLILVVLALSAALALVVGRAVRQRAAAKRTKAFRRRSSPKRLPAVPPPSDEPPGFLEELKRREEHVDAGVPEIIEVTDVEIVDDEP